MQASVSAADVSTRQKRVQLPHVRPGSKKFCQGSAGPEPKIAEIRAPGMFGSPHVKTCLSHMLPRRKVQKGAYNNNQRVELVQQKCMAAPRHHVENNKST